MATSENFIAKFIVQGVEKIDQAKDKIDKLDGRVKNLSNTLLTVGFGAFISQALQAADRISDFSQATNISIASLKALEAAMNASGGSGKNLEKSINTLFASIEGAVQGSDKLRDSFARVGVSLNDLQNLSEADILQKVLEGLAEMPAGAERSALAAQLLNRSMRAVDPKQLLEALDPQKYRDSEEATKKAADAQQNLEKAYKNLQEGALKALQPILDILGEKNLTVDAAQKLVTALGIALGITFGAKAIAAVAGMVIALKNFNTALAVTAGLSNLLGKTPLGAILKLGAAVGAGAGIGAAISELSKQNEQLADTATDAANAQARVLGAEPGKISAADPSQGGALRDLGISARDRALMQSDQRIRLSNEEILFQQRLQNADDVAKATIAAEREIFRMVEEIRANTDLNDEQKTLEIAARRKEITAKLETDIFNIRKRQNDQFNKEFAASQIETDRIAALQGASLRERINIASDADIAKARLEIFSNETLTLEQQEKLFAQRKLEIQTKAQNEFFQLVQDQTRILDDQQKGYRKTVEDLLGYEKTELQKVNDLIKDQPEKYRDIGDQMRANAQAQDSNLRLLKETIREQERQKSLLQEQNAIVFRGANEYGDFLIEQKRQGELRDAENQKQRIFINLYYDTIVKTMQTERQMQTFQKFRTALMYEGNDLSAEQSQHIADHLTLARQLADQAEEELKIRKEAVELELARTSTFEYGFEQAFKKYREDATDAAKAGEQAFQLATRGIEDAFVNLATKSKTTMREMANAIIADIVRVTVRRSIAGFSAMGGFGAIFGMGGVLGPTNEMAGAAVMGLPGFAAGGMIGANQPAIIGEKGPELFIPNSAGTIVPNNKLAEGSGFGGTTVNYNISAVDAASFRQLVARDPQFIYNVTEAGRRSQPTRRLS